MSEFVILGPSVSPRIDAFQSGLADLRRSPAPLVSYDAFLRDHDSLFDALNRQTILRIESPDRDPVSLRALYAAGAAGAEAAGFQTIDRDAAVTRKGEIGSPAQLWFGLRKALKAACASAESAGASVLIDREQTATMFDKAGCARLLAGHQVPAPAQLGLVERFEQLMATMHSCACTRVFLKLRHGSAAAGMMALALGPRHEIVAYTTAVQNDRGGISATRRIQKLSNHSSIEAIVDRLAPLGLTAEQWLPKSGIEGRTYDLRVIVIGGEPVFHVMRQSTHPMTNLHLGGKRGSADTIRRRIGEDHWASLNRTCRKVAGIFAGNFMIGIDVAILAGERKHAVLEVNAFGDHVKNVYYRGTTPQQCQVLRANRWLSA